MWKKILPIGLVLVMVLSFVACVGEPSAQEIVDAVIEAQDDIRTCEFEMDMTLDMSGEVEGEAVEVTLTMEFSGALDLDNREMRIDLSTDTDMEMPREPDEGELTMVTFLAGEVRMAMYHVGGMRYAMMGAAGEEPRWMMSEAAEADWEEMSEGIALILQTEAQIGLLETAQVKVIGSEKVKGVDCYVLQLTPDMEQLWQLAMQQPILPGEEGPDVAEEFLQEMFRSVSVKQWIAKDTYFLIKAEIDMVFESIELTAEAMGLEEGTSLPTYISIVLLSYNYNQPVSIELPPEAEEAAPME